MSYIQEDIHITDVIIEEMTDTEGLSVRRYSAIINGLRIMYETNIIIRPGHMSRIEWVLAALDSYLYKTDEENKGGEDDQ
jgi:hypothetical protein